MRIVEIDHEQRGDTGTDADVEGTFGEPAPDLQFILRRKALPALDRGSLASRHNRKDVEPGSRFKSAPHEPVISSPRLRHRRGRHRRDRRPRARGGGPATIDGVAVAIASSPRSRGWSPRRAGRGRADAGRPRARGGGPSEPSTTMSAAWSSPRSRGWSHTLSAEGRHSTVVPALAGVVLWLVAAGGIARPATPSISATIFVADNAYYDSLDPDSVVGTSCI
jgi:hypothetical protein